MIVYFVVVLSYENNCRFNDVRPILPHALSAHVRALDHDPSLLANISKNDSKFGALVPQRRILDQYHGCVPSAPIASYELLGE